MASLAPILAESAFIVSSTANATNDEINQFYFYEVNASDLSLDLFCISSFTLSLPLNEHEKLGQVPPQTLPQVKLPCRFGLAAPRRKVSKHFLKSFFIRREHASGIHKLLADFSWVAAVIIFASLSLQHVAG